MANSTPVENRVEQSTVSHNRFALRSAPRSPAVVLRWLEKAALPGVRKREDRVHDTGCLASLSAVPP